MQPATPTAPETPRDSATVVLLRDAPAGMEVLLLRRHAQASNMAGVYVFPGGKLDEADRTLGSGGLLDQPTATLHTRLAEPGTDAATAS
ncbi:MAG: NUDIX hydrolase, partial [Comamonadaceae bacterium]|nr:NUDIX hydrolase [Comamonadaceae bacterium]